VEVEEDLEETAVFSFEFSNELYNTFDLDDVLAFG
jgi:hypothetical protein